jgi:hypothetical protein
MKIYFDYSILDRGFNVFAYEETEGQATVVYELAITKVTVASEYEALPRSARVSKPEMAAIANALIEGLVSAGFLAPQAHATDAELAATKRHLEDMRSLVWKAPKP